MEDPASIYIAPRIAAKKYGVSKTTLAQWAEKGKIRAIRCGTGPTVAHRYLVSDIEAFFQQETKNINNSSSERRIVILYARVSSSKQKDAGDLERQIQQLKDYCPTYDKIIQDVASGLNFKRKGLTSILDLVEEGGVEKIVVSYRDRLARFGIDLLERTFKKHRTILDVV